MKHFFSAVILAFFVQMVSASPLVEAMHAEDKTRVCRAAAPSEDTRLLTSEAAYMLSTMGVAADAISVLIADCGNFAVAALTLNTIVVPTGLAKFPRQERLFVLAHEIGHLVNKDANRWADFGDELVRAPTDESTALRQLSVISQEVELRADAFAAVALLKVGINPHTAAIAFFQHMHVLDAPSNISHPAPKHRVELMAQLALQ